MSTFTSDGLRVGIVGATGQVGTVLREILAQRNFPLGELRFFASARSAGSTLPWGDGEITVYGVPDRPGEAAQIFRVLADAEINIDMIVQNVSAGASKTADISFTLPVSDGPTALAALEKVKHTVGFSDVRFDQHIGKVSLVGAGMRSHPGVSAKFFGALADAGVNLELISTSEIRISVVTRDTDVDVAVRAVHDAFELGSDDVEAVVYGGTGR
jgi:aspartate kinase